MYRGGSKDQWLRNIFVVRFSERCYLNLKQKKNPENRNKTRTYLYDPNLVMELGSVINYYYNSNKIVDPRWQL